MRRALENSRNLATAHLLKGGIEDKPEASLERLCQLALEAQIYRECVHLYPFVLGAEPVRPVDLAAFYAGEVLSKKNGHVRVNLHAIGNVHIGLRVPSTSLAILLPCGLGKPTHGKAVPDVPGDPR